MSSDSQSTRSPVAVVTIAAVVLSYLEWTGVAKLPVRFLLERVFADDYFYYLVLAQNVSSGLGVSFDGSVQTNGFHPLYLILLSLLARSGELGGWELVRRGISLPLIAHNLCAIPAALIFHRLGMGRWAYILAFSWLLNPFGLQLAALGLEAPIATMFLVTLVAVLAKPIPVLLFRQILVGILLGGAILARTDSLLAVLPLSVWCAFAPKERIPRMSGITILISAFCVTFPWWYWNLIEFGTVLQSSGIATRLHSRLGGDGILADTLRSLSAYCFLLGVAAVVPLIGIWLYTRTSGREDVQVSRFSSFSLWSLCSYFLLIGGYYVFYARHVQGWYVHSSSLAVLSLGMYLLGNRIPSPRILPTVTAAIGFSLVSWMCFNSSRGASLQWSGYELARWVNGHSKPGDIVGTWNSGIVGFFTDRPVVNLDGVVNNQIVEIMRRPDFEGLRSLKPYIDGRRISILLDYEPILPPDLSGLGFRSVSVEAGSVDKVFVRK